MPLAPLEECCLSRDMFINAPWSATMYFNQRIASRAINMELSAWFSRFYAAGAL